jgi:hypothetical protein
MDTSASTTSTTNSTADSTTTTTSTADNTTSVYEQRRRQTALEAVERDAATAWTNLPVAARSDKQFVLAALKKSPLLPPKSDFERQFPQALRFDRDIVLAFCNRHDFLQLYYDRHLFVPDCLTSDKQVMLAYCSKIPRSLQECCEELTDDRDVVEAAVQLDGLELQYASIRLQEEKDIVVAACTKDGRALEFCPPGKVRDELTADRDFMMTVLKQHGGPMLRLVPDHLKKDRELLLEALAHGMRFRFCPLAYQSDQTFLVAAVSRKSEIYFDLGRTNQAVPDIALAAVTAADSIPAVHQRAMETVPSLKSNRNVVLALSARGDASFLKDFFTEADVVFKDDKEIMLTAVARDSKLFPYASARLRADAELLLAAIDEGSAVDVLKTVSPAMQLEHPEIALKAVQTAWPRNLRILQPYVQEELWQNREIVMAWIRRGCRVLPAFEAMVAEDEQVALEIAEHSWREFAKVGNGLKANVEFMTKAVDTNGRVLRFSAPSIRDDLNLVVRAVASHADALVPSIRVDKATLTQHVQDKLELHKTFVNEFLRGIAVPTPHIPPSRRSQLPMLDRGVETSQAFKQLIAAFLGVPVGDDLRIMRTCYKNLTDPPPPLATERGDMETHLFDRWARRRMRGRGNAQPHHWPLQENEHDNQEREHFNRVILRFEMVRNNRAPRRPAPLVAAIGIGGGIGIGIGGVIVGGGGAGGGGGGELRPGANANLPLDVDFEQDILEMMMDDQEDGWDFVMGQP